MSRDIIGNRIVTDSLVLWNGVVYNVVDISEPDLSIVGPCGHEKSPPIITLATRMPAVGHKAGDAIFDMYVLPSPAAGDMIDRMLGGGPLVPPTKRTQ